MITEFIYLKRVHEDILASTVLLWQLLQERKPEESIWHHRMPTPQEHTQYVMSDPHPHWYVVHCGENMVGSCCITVNDEVGISILNEYKRRGFGKAAVQALMAKVNGERLLANINYKNRPSVGLFKSLGWRQIGMIDTEEGVTYVTMESRPR